MSGFSAAKGYANMYAGSLHSNKHGLVDMSQ